MKVAEFLAMGGYAAYVWPAYALVFAVLALNIWSARRSHERALEEARRRLMQEEPGR